MAFIMDQLLPQCQESGDKDCSALARVLLASLASCNHSPEAQTTLVTELKGALQRALMLPESADKHARVQAQTNLISTVIESCPSPGIIPNQVRRIQHLRSVLSPNGILSFVLLSRNFTSKYTNLAYECQLKDSIPLVFS